MDSKIPASFWQNDALHTPELLLAALWLRSHSGINLAGFAEISVRRFCFETHLKPEALDHVAEALGKGLVREGTGYWLRDFIADEFGRGQQLAANNMAAAVVRALALVQSPWVALAVLEEYPELKDRWNECHSWKGSPRGTQVQRAGAGAGARAGVRGGVGENVPPTLVQVQAYALEIGAPAEEAVAFFDHFEANGWKVSGKTPMRSWKGSFRTWVRRSARFGKKSDVRTAVVEAFDPKAPNAHTGGAAEAK